MVLTASALAAPAQTAKPACDRACLDKTVDSYLAAVVAHDPSKVKFAPDVKFVENTVPMKPGEGFWKTASALPTTFKIYVPDPVAQQVGFLCVMMENGKPMELGLRLKLRNGQIVEAEHLLARNLFERSLANLQTPRPGLLTTVPPAQRVPRERNADHGQSPAPDTRPREHRRNGMPGSAVHPSHELHQADRTTARESHGFHHAV